MKKPDLSSIQRIVVSPAGVTLLVALIYLGVVLARAGGDPLEFVRIGTRFSQRDLAGTEGYDGQFVYYIARDPNPETVANYLDVPAYRYQRILLPLFARALSLGNLDLLPWFLPAINLSAHLVAVWLLAALLERGGVTRWYALVYGLWPGLLLGLRLDLPEPLAFGLVIAAIWFHRRDRFLVAFVCYGLALFAKETTLLFVGAYLLTLLFQKQWRLTVSLLLVAILPYALFRLWLPQQFGQSGFSLGGVEASPPEIIPFMGLLRMWEYNQVYFFAQLLAYLPSIILPVVWGLLSASKRLTNRDLDMVSFALGANAVIFLFMPLPLYISTGGTMRLAIGLVLATLLFVARYKLERPLKYIPFWLAMNAVLLQEFFSSQVGLN